MARIDGRSPNQLRPVHFIVDFLDYAEGSVLIETGKTRVLCAASVEEKVPPFLEGKGQGWVTAEYDMLPRATNTRNARERSGRISGRTQEIQRLIGRSLRAAVDMTKLGERTITVDCDVLQADGGTRTASITGAFVAMAEALGRMRSAGMISADPIRQHVAAVSCGILDGEAILDLDYAEDFAVETDLNCVMGEDGRLMELQATAEGQPFSRAELEAMLELAGKGILELIEIQKQTLATLVPR